MKARLFILCGLMVSLLVSGATGQSTPTLFQNFDADVSISDDSTWATLQSASGLVPRSDNATTISIYGGWNFTDEEYSSSWWDFSPRNSTTRSGAAGIAVGKKFGPRFRTELEFGWRRDVENYRRITYPQNALLLLPPFSPDYLQGEVNTYTGMVNFYFEFDRASERLLTPYAGVGIGFAYLDTDLTINSIGSSVSNETAFAYQGIAGVSLKLTQQSDFFVEYRLYGTDSTEFTQPSYRGMGPVEYFESYSNHNLFMGIRFYF